MEFRVAEYKDYEAIAQLQARSWKANYRGMVSDDYLDDDVFNDKRLIWQTRLTNPPLNQHVVLAEENHVLVGMICVFGNHDFEKGTFIDSLHVNPAYQHRGIGSELLRMAALWQLHYFENTGIYLEVIEDNTQAIEFYKDIGGIVLDDKKIAKIPGNDNSEVIDTIIAWPSAETLLKALQAVLIQHSA